MGHQPRPPNRRPAPPRPPTREERLDARRDRWLEELAQAFAAGDLDLERLEELIDHVLRGGGLTPRLEPRDAPPLPPPRPAPFRTESIAR